jgi:hypothetical protein
VAKGDMDAQEICPLILLLENTDLPLRRRPTQLNMISSVTRP